MFFAAAPPGNIAEGVVPGVQAQVLADGIGHALRLHLAGAPVLLMVPYNDPALHREGVQFGVGNLMDQCFDGLGLAHAGAEGDPLLRVVICPMDTWRQGSLSDGDGGDGC